MAFDDNDRLDESSAARSSADNTGAAYDRVNSSTRDMAGAAGSGGSTASLREAPPKMSNSSGEQVLPPSSPFSVPPLNVPRVAVVSPSRPAAPAPSSDSERSDAGSLRGTPLSPPRGCRRVDGSSRWLKAIEIDKESVAYLRKHFPELGDGLIEGDFLKMDLSGLFPGQFSIIGNFPYNISSQIFFKIIDNRDLIPEVVCMIQKEVAERIAEKPGTKTYGILSVFLQAWYDIEYLFTVGPGSFNPPPKVQSAVIRLTRNSRTELGCDEKLFKTVVKTSFGQRRKTLRNSLKPLLAGRSFVGAKPPQDDNAASGTCHSEPGTCHSEPGTCHSEPGTCHSERSEESPLTDPVFDLRPERLSVEDFISLTLRLTP